MKVTGASKKACIEVVSYFTYWRIKNILFELILVFNFRADKIRENLSALK